MRKTSLTLVLLMALSVAANVASAQQAVATVSERRAAHYDQIIATLISPPQGSSRVLIAEALGEAHEDVVPKIIQLLEHPDTIVGQYACVALTRMQNRASAAIPRLAEIARIPGHPLRCDAVTALIYIRSDDPIVIETLADVVRTDEEVNLCANTLRNSRILSTTAIPVFAAALQNPSREVRLESMLLLTDIEEDFSALAELVVDACDESDGEMCEVASDTLRTMVPAAEPALIRMASFTHPLARQRAVSILATRRHASEDAVNAFVRSSKDQDAAVRFWAAKGLIHGGSSQLAVDTLLTLATDEDEDVRWQAVQTLGRLESQADGVVECLRRQLEDHHPSVQFAAALGIWRITGETEQPSQILRDLANETHSAIGRESIALLRKIESAKR